MEKLLSKEFYTNIENLITERIKNEANKLTLQKVDWEKEAENCFIGLTLLLGEVNLERLKENSIDKIGVIDICWNEYGSDIEVDFMPDNNFETAFIDGCIMNDSAIDNDNFFKTYFDVNGENAWNKIGDDYHEIILVFYYIILLKILLRLWFNKKNSKNSQKNHLVILVLHHFTMKSELKYYR